MALAIYSKSCAKNSPGNNNKVYFAAYNALTSLTLTSGEISAVTASAGVFKKYEAEIDSVNFKSEGEGSSNFFLKQTLTLKFAKKVIGLQTAIDNLLAEVPCGLIAIRVDGNGKAWLIGYDYAATDKTSRPLNHVKVSFDSGTKPSDADAGMVTVELTRESEYDEIPFDTTQSTAIAGGTAAYITYS